MTETARRGEAAPPNPPLPNVVFWNLTYLGLSKQHRRDQKLANASVLCRNADIVCFQEVRYSSAESESGFFSHLPGRYTFYQTGVGLPGMAISVKQSFAELHGLDTQVLARESANHHFVLGDGHYNNKII